MGKRSRRDRDENDECDSSAGLNEIGDCEIGERTAHTEYFIQKKFAVHLIHAALAESLWEAHEMTVLIKLILSQLDISSNKKIYKFLKKCEIHEPQVLSSLADEGVIELDSKQIFKIISSGCNDVIALFGKIEEALEQGIFKLNDREFIDLVASKLLDCSYENRLRFSCKICSHAELKEQCALLLLVFTSDLHRKRAAEFICEILTNPDFQDVPGNYVEFKNQFRELSIQFDETLPEVVDKLLPEYAAMDDEGVVDSDADENGNLSGFIVASDVDDASINSDKSIESLQDDDNDDDEDDDDDDEDDFDDDEYFRNIAINERLSKVRQGASKPDTSNSIREEDCERESPKVLRNVVKRKKQQQLHQQKHHQQQQQQQTAAGVHRKGRILLDDEE